MRWLLVRHGESVANAEGWLAGWRDVALTPRGEAQARALADVLGPTGYTRVFASDLQRAWRTAELATGREVARLAGLRERHLGGWEGRFRESLVSQGHMATLLSWSQGPPQGESQRDLARRVLGALAGLESDAAGPTVVVVHGGVLRVLDGLHHGRPRAELGTSKFANTVVLDWELPAGRWAELAADLDDDGTHVAPGAVW